ncbi:MAG: zinc ribbon domain-containing protein [candidate division Zixibacteria bacterium]|nr:zinc ribbon domain-containing protein [candidate division Zixibacteria bacterium]MBU1470957.1 zinc ribbon domain-containing protein [candidate division Zixibacteria bacterium]MBU2625472.1 zinc ribbon domain-containing protein [candidate division Zixibacteria bacterium]
MPMFEFKCSKCGHDFEELVFSSTPYSARCPKCDSPEVEKKISAFSSGGSPKTGGGCNPFG